MNENRPSRKRALTADEADLWARAMRDAKKLPDKRSGRDVTADCAEPVRAQLQSDPPGPASPAVPSLTPSAASPPIASFDQRQKRKLARKAETIDSRIDLHGMRQAQAYAALRRFLLACAARGDRNVLVITGKGTAAERSRDYLAEQRGVLRRLVPEWLQEPELRAIVVSYTSAGPRHGGDGALYVRIRRAGRRA